MNRIDMAAFMKQFVGTLALLFLAGCATYSGPYTYGTKADGTPIRTTSLEEANRQVGEGTAVQYRVGYMQGCDSGRFSEGDTTFQHTKDEQRYGVDALYRQGWDFGYIQCKNQMQVQRYYPAPYYSYPAYPYSSWYLYPSFSFRYGRGFGYWGRPYSRFGGFYRFHGFRHRH